MNYSNLTVTGVPIFDNTASSGGGICQFIGDMTLSSVDIYDNTTNAPNNAGRGGGIFIVEATTTISDCNLFDNESDYGAGIYSESYSKSRNDSISDEIVSHIDTVGITFLRDEATAWQYGSLTATIVLTLIPVMIIFLTMQKYFIKGILEGALKG